MVIMSDVAGLVPLTTKSPTKTVGEEDEHEVEYAPNGDVVLSPSQVEKFLMCPRKWAARYIHGQHEPVGESAAAGKRMHKLLENYYKKGTVPSNETPEGVWALALIAKTNLPLPKPGAKTPHEGPLGERKMKFEHGGVWWRGSKDLTYVRDGLYRISDYKSTSALNPLWVKNEERLKTDPQSIIYAFEAFLIDEPDEVENEWRYVTRVKYPDVELHRVRMTWDMTRRGMDILTRVGHEMLKYYRERPELNDLEAVGTTNGGCEAYRGCKVIGCNVSALDRIKGQQLFNARKQGGSDMQSYADRLRERNAQQAALTSGATASAPTSAPAPAPEAAETPAPVGDIRTRLAAATAAAGNGSSVAPPTFTPPPDASQGATAAPAPVPTGVAAAQSTAPLTPSTDPPKRGRGRARAAAAPAPTPGPEGAQVAVTDANSTGGVIDPTPAPERPATPVGIAAAATPLDGYVLCVNCGPIGDPNVVLFSQYAAQIHQALKEAKGWNHYALYSFDGKAAFQDCLQQHLESQPPVGYLVVYENTDEGRDALPVLERFCLGKPFRRF